MGKVLERLKSHNYLCKTGGVANTVCPDIYKNGIHFITLIEIPSLDKIQLDLVGNNGALLRDTSKYKISAFRTITGEIVSRELFNTICINVHFDDNRLSLRKSFSFESDYINIAFNKDVTYKGTLLIKFKNSDCEKDSFIVFFNRNTSDFNINNEYKFSSFIYSGFSGIEYAPREGYRIKFGRAWLDINLNGEICDADGRRISTLKPEHECLQMLLMGVDYDC